jgi:O-antigen/teichoic acid export membrane protein
VAGPQFAASATVLQIQGLAMIATFVLAGWSFALLSLRRYRGLLVANASAFVVSCSLTLVLAGTDGAEGAAVATVAAETALAVGLLAVLVRGYPQLRPSAKVVVKVVLAALPAIALALLPDVPSVVRALLALGAYGLVIAATRAVPAEVLELIPYRPRKNA